MELPLPKGVRRVCWRLLFRANGARATRLLEDLGAKVKVGVSQTKVWFEIGLAVLKLIDGTFSITAASFPHNNVMKEGSGRTKSAVDRVSTIARAAW
ncbi:hypothetical protein [Bradyrhizobium sp. RDI18]|uniref:hypothetical protein n=1 Tax=Bradyrhizobium sp. RDI18 TaxID=3367400 RepID=UPI0037228FEB